MKIKLVKESIHEDNSYKAKLAIDYVESLENKNLAKNYRWLINNIKDKINTTSTEFSEQEYNFIERFSNKAIKKWKGLDCD